jgi:hypothetical protein
MFSKITSNILCTGKGDAMLPAHVADELHTFSLILEYAQQPLRCSGKL